jgi:hypothetical protein
VPQPPTVGPPLTPPTTRSSRLSSQLGSCSVTVSLNVNIASEGLVRTPLGTDKDIEFITSAGTFPNLSSARRVPKKIRLVIAESIDIVPNMAVRILSLLERRGVYGCRKGQETDGRFHGVGWREWGYVWTNDCLTNDCLMNEWINEWVSEWVNDCHYSGRDECFIYIFSYHGCDSRTTLALQSVC